ncbi:MAG: rRNA maturation RNase YbeY [Actinomycetota bacterium]|nr:rRNA maturation RNase YbeY [Actinomycetota bacterium]
MTAEVFVGDEQSALPMEVDRWGGLARYVLEAEAVPEDCELSILFVDRGTIAALNGRFREVDEPTDVLAFGIDDDQGVGSGRSPDGGGTGPGWVPPEPADMPFLLGDVVICPEVAAANAAEHGVTLDREVALLVVHGILHLRGHDHEEEKEAQEMERLEQELLERWWAGEAGPVGEVEERRDGGAA